MNRKIIITKRGREGRRERKKRKRKRVREEESEKPHGGGFMHPEWPLFASPSLTCSFTGPSCDGNTPVLHDINTPYRTSATLVYINKKYE